VGLRERTVDRILRTRRKMVSLDWPKLEHDERSLADLVASFGVSTEQLLVDRETRKAVFVAFRSLSPQQQTVLVLRFGLGGHRPLTLREIGLQIGRSRERVRQIENQAKQHIRTQLAKRTRSRAKRSQTSLSH
jgi:RNA polymerase sigma factor (sigma-70 family)